MFLPKKASFSDRNRGFPSFLSEISRSVRCTSARSWRKVWSEAKKRITFASSKSKSNPDERDSQCQSMYCSTEPPDRKPLSDHVSEPLPRVRWSMSEWRTIRETRQKLHRHLLPADMRTQIQQLQVTAKQTNNIRPWFQTEIRVVS